MANQRKHIEKALHNESFLEKKMLGEDYPDWYITISFYAAVHWIRAYLALNGCASNNNDDLHYDDFQSEMRRIGREALKANPKSKLLDLTEKAIEEFFDIKSLARDSRYRCGTLGDYARRTGEADTALKNVRKFVTTHGITP